MITLAYSAIMPLLEASNSFFENLIGSLGIHPRHFEGLYPLSVTPDYLNDLIQKGQFPTITGLAPAVTYFLILSFVRFLLQNYVVKPIAAKFMNIKLHSFAPMKDIDRIVPWKPKYVVGEKDITKIHQQLPNHSNEAISRYLWERKRYMINHQKIVKFVEAFWRAVFYTGFSIIGYYALFVPTTAIWFWDNKHHFADWPFHELTPAINFYYQIELGCYFHQLLWTEVTRSDAAEMITHHFVTIILIIASYISGFFRIGASILFLHDLADIFLEIAKVFNYTSKPAGQRWMKTWIVDPLFAVFAVTFFVTRLVFFPKNILYSVFADGYGTFDCDWFGCSTFIGLLFALQFLHVFWFYLIARMVYKLAMGTMQDDERSDNEEELEQEPTPLSKYKGNSNERGKTKKPKTKQH